MFVDKNDRRRETWRWQDAPPDMGRKLGLDRDPMEFDRIFKMSFECFQHIVNWVVDEGNPSRNRSTPFQMWYKGARASSGTVSTVVGCGVLYLFSEASEMKDAKLLGIGVKALSFENPLSQIATVHNSHISNNNQKRWDHSWVFRSVVGF